MTAVDPGARVWVWVESAWSAGRVLRGDGHTLVVRYVTYLDQLGTVTVPVSLIWPDRTQTVPALDNPPAG